MLPCKENLLVGSQMLPKFVISIPITYVQAIPVTGKLQPYDICFLFLLSLTWLGLLTEMPMLLSVS
jgi:hypothetical protein